MFTGFPLLTRCVLAAFVCSIPGTSTWARGDAPASVSALSQEIPAPAFALADQIDAMLSDRFASADAVESIDARRQALEALDQFAKLTVEGLIEASQSGEMREVMEARLRPVLVRLQGNIAAALADAGGRPLVKNTYSSPVSGGF